MSSLEYKVGELAKLLNGEVLGDASAIVSGFGKIEGAQAGELAFLSNPKYEPYLYTTEATAVLVSREFVPRQVLETTLIKVDNPYTALAMLMQLAAEQLNPRKSGIDARAFISESATIGQDCYIGSGVVVEEGAKLGARCQVYPNVYIGRGVVVGDDCVIYPNVTVYYGCQLGKSCVVHAGAVIGADGFGFAPQLDGYQKIPQLGNVIIEDCVEVGANTCIDRATLGSTIIRRGVKLDNLVQIAHNVEVGSHTVLAAQVGIAGSTKLGSWCQAGGQVGIAGHLTIGDRVQMAGQTGILGSIKPDQTIMGSPAMDASVAMRSYAALRRLPDLLHRLDQLEKELKANKQ